MLVYGTGLPAPVPAIALAYLRVWWLILHTVGHEQLDLKLRYARDSPGDNVSSGAFRTHKRLLFGRTAHKLGFPILVIWIRPGLCYLDSNQPPVNGARRRSRRRILSGEQLDEWRCSDDGQLL